MDHEGSFQRCFPYNIPQHVIDTSYVASEKEFDFKDAIQPIE
jgi:hypothetical protein